MHKHSIAKQFLHVDLKSILTTHIKQSDIGHLDINDSQWVPFSSLWNTIFTVFLFIYNVNICEKIQPAKYSICLSVMICPATVNKV